MAARLRPQHQDEVRLKIKASQLVNRLQNHALGELDKPMDATQIKATEVLLDRVLPKLSATTVAGDPNQPLRFELSAPWLTAAIRDRNS